MTGTLPATGGTLGYDVVVVGAGTAGIPCALAAADGGARVLLLEKADRVGGTLHVSGGHLSAAGTRRQRARGIADSVAMHADDVRRISRGTVPEHVLVPALAEAAQTVDWLEDHGFVFAPETPRIVYGHEPYSVPRTYYGPDQARSILAVLSPLLDAAVAAGRVELRLGAAVTELLPDNGGRSPGVAGVRTADGTAVRAPAVVLATGGYASAPELFAQLEGVPLYSAASATSAGDGLRLAAGVGAAVAGRGMYLPTFGGLPAPEGDEGRVVWGDRPLLVATERPPWEIYVDRRGRRFVAEDEVSIDGKERALLALEGMTFWTVFDAAALAASQPMVMGWTPEQLDQHANTRAGVLRAPSLVELAVAAGIDPAGLVVTVERYNAGVRAGRDEDLGRTHLPAPIAQPPFYALQNHGTTLISFAGVDVDGQLRVRRADGGAIRGLYAVGEVLGAAATSGNAFCGGMLLTPALTLGRQLGRTLAAAAAVTPAATPA